MICFDTFEEALNHFLGFKMRNRKPAPPPFTQGETLFKTYGIAGGVGQFRQYCGQKNTLPKFTWKTHTPEAYDGKDTKKLIKRYLTPFVVQTHTRTRRKRVKPSSVQRMPIEHGVRMSEYNAEPYKDILKRLLENNPFEETQND